MHDHAPDVESAVHVEPLSVHVPLDESVSLEELAVATESWMVDPTGADPVNVSVLFVVMLSVLDGPLSDAVARSGVVATGIAYLMTTRPEPPAPPSMVPVPPPPPPPPPRLATPLDPATVSPPLPPPSVPVPPEPVLVRLPPPPPPPNVVADPVNDELTPTPPAPPDVDEPFDPAPPAPPPPPPV